MQETSLPERTRDAYTAKTVERIVQAAYALTPADGLEERIAYLLADLRHVCDARQLDFARIDRHAYRMYAAEHGAPR